MVQHDDAMPPKHVQTAAWLFAAAIALALCASPIMAASPPPLGVHVYGVDEDAKACGLSEDAITSQAVLTLRANGVLPAGEITNPFLNINVTVARAANSICIVNIAVRVEGFTTEDLSNAPFGGFEPRRGRVTILCEGGEVLSHHLTANPGRAILEAIESDIKTCLGKLNY